MERQRRREEAEREAIADAVKKKERWNSGDATYSDEIAGLVVWNMICFPYIGNNHPSCLKSFRGVETTNQMMKYVGFMIDKAIMLYVLFFLM